ncbi:hypothetical protein DFQ03_0003 [Maribacter caenipelagi]|uniref:Uncharacterized protein n=1 Tax=Maribacter caenipelagi TaxID=1447781 RepID=A0A4R7DGZ9_9FLAO|nr:hypothetical protein DFQ03_0003 [Maribacter caenipelagi]
MVVQQPQNLNVMWTSGQKRKVCVHLPTALLAIVVTVKTTLVKVHKKIIYKVIIHKFSKLTLLRTL